MVTSHERKVFLELTAGLILPQTENKMLQSAETVTPTALRWARVVTRGHLRRKLHGRATFSLQG